MRFDARLLLALLGSAACSATVPSRGFVAGAQPSQAATIAQSSPTASAVPQPDREPPWVGFEPSRLAPEPMILDLGVRPWDINTSGNLLLEGLRGAGNRVLWDVAEAQPLRRVPQHVSFFPGTDQLLAFGSTLSLLDASGRELRQLGPQPRAGLFFSSNHRYAARWQDQGVEIVSLETGKPVGHVPLDAPESQWLFWSLLPNDTGERLGVGGSGSARIFDTRTGKRLARHVAHCHRANSVINWHPDAKRLGVVHHCMDSFGSERPDVKDTELVVISERSAPIARSFRGSTGIWTAEPAPRFKADGRMVAASGMVFELAPSSLRNPLSAIAAPSVDSAVLPNGDWVTLPERRPLTRVGEVLAWSADGRWLLDDDGHDWISAYDAHSGVKLGRLGRRSLWGTGGYNEVPNFQFVVLGSRPAVIFSQQSQLDDAGTSNIPLRWVFDEPSAVPLVLAQRLTVLDVHFIGGRLLRLSSAFGGSAGPKDYAALVDLGSARVERYEEPPRMEPRVGLFSEEWNNAVRLEQAVLADAWQLGANWSDAYFSLTSSRDGRHLAANTREDVVLFDRPQRIDSTQAPPTLTVPTPILNCPEEAVLAFSPDSRWLIVECDRAISVWDVVNNVLWFTTPKLPGVDGSAAVPQLSFDPSSTLLAVAGRDRIYLVHLSRRALLELVLTRRAGERGLRLLSIAPNGWVDGDEQALDLVRYENIDGPALDVLQASQRYKATLRYPGLLESFIQK